MSGEVEAAASEKMRVARAKSRERMQRSRRRRADGMRCFTLELRDTEIRALVRCGLLASGDRTDRNAVIRAMYEFLDRSLGRPV